MATYNVTIEAKATAADSAEMLTVQYEAPDYHEAWVGARTVCRMGSHPKLRIFTKDDEPISIPAGVYTVRKIFVENTRKSGKQRMTTLSAQQLLQLLDDRGVRTSKNLRETLVEALGQSEGEGVRITVATARRLGLISDEVPRLEAGNE